MVHCPDGQTWAMTATGTDDVTLWLVELDDPVGDVLLEQAHQLLDA